MIRYIVIIAVAVVCCYLLGGVLYYGDLASAFTPSATNGTLIKPTVYDAVNKTLSATDTRKAFGYCPVDLSLYTSKGISVSVEGCPTFRVYVEHWDLLSDTQKRGIASDLLSKGFRIEDN